MVYLPIQEKDKVLGTYQIQDEQSRENVRTRRSVILDYLKSVGEEKDTSFERKVERPYHIWDLACMTAQNFYELVIRPVNWGWMVEAFLTFEQEQEQEEEREESQYGVLHDYVLDDLSVDYDSAEKFHKYLMSLRRQHEHEKKIPR